MPSELPEASQMLDGEAELRVLLLPPTRKDGDAINRLLGDNGITCLACQTVEGLCGELGRGAGVVVLSEEAVVRQTALLVSSFRTQPVWSDVPILVLSRTGSESPTLAAIVKQLGSASVVERPVRLTTFLSLVRTALRARERQYEVRNHLIELGNAGRAVRAGEQRYRLLVENIKDYAIFLIDLENRVSSWNAGSEAMLGYSASEIVGKSAALFFTDSDRAAGLPELEIRQAREAGRSENVRWHMRKGGSLFFVDGVLTAVHDEGGALRGFSKLMRDVTDRKRVEQERQALFESERAARAEAELQGRMKDEFLATLSHELRTPLSAILGWSQILSRGIAKPEVLAEGLRTIERNARAQTQIIEDLLDMSRIISGKVALDLRPIDLADVVRAAIETVRATSIAKGVDLAFDQADLRAPITGDVNRLQQVFWNLLSNAIKFTPRGGRVEVRIEERHALWQVAVTDTGEGMSQDFLPFIFDRFRQADASTTRRHGGLGLGLSIVKQLVEVHGGKVLVKSDGLGSGSTFIVSLPTRILKDESANGKVSRPPVFSDAQTTPVSTNVASNENMAWDPALCDRIRGLKVLIVDDEPDARALLKRLLVDCGVNVLVAATADETLAMLERERPDVLVSDVGMPIVDGHELIRRVRALPANRGGQTPAIALTAYARTEDRMKAIRAGFQMHVPKPVEPAELMTMIASVMR